VERTKEKRKMMNPVIVEVIAPTLASPELSFRGFGLILRQLGLQKKHSDACSDEYPDDWKEAVAMLSQWIKDISCLYRHRVHIQVIDAFSPLGLWKQIRYGLHRFPAFVVDRKSTYVGWDAGKLESLIDERIRQMA
jgi:hypothetical protein